MAVLDVLRTETRRPRIVRECRHAGRLAVGAVCLGTVIGQADAGMVAFCLPALQRHFSAPLAAVEWVALGYLLVMTAWAGVLGRLGDVAGHKLTFLYGLVILTVASVIGGLAPTLSVLIASRALQAVGAAMVQAAGTALIVTGVSSERRRAALGVLGGVHALGLAIGPAAGALLVEAAGWR